jgi:hypothetical protein
MMILQQLNGMGIGGNCGEKLSIENSSLPSIWPPSTQVSMQVGRQFSTTLNTAIGCPNEIVRNLNIANLGIFGKDH